MTVTVCPAIVSVPERATPVLGVAEYVTTSECVPLAPFTIVNHDVLDLAVHAQPLVVSTATVSGPPASVIVRIVADNV